MSVSSNVLTPSRPKDPQVYGCPCPYSSVCRPLCLGIRLCPFYLPWVPLCPYAPTQWSQKIVKAERLILHKLKARLNVAAHASGLTGTSDLKDDMGASVQNSANMSGVPAGNTVTLS